MSYKTPHIAILALLSGIFHYSEVGKLLGRLAPTEKLVRPLSWVGDTALELSTWIFAIWLGWRLILLLHRFLGWLIKAVGYAGAAARQNGVRLKRKLIILSKRQLTKWERVGRPPDTT